MDALIYRIWGSTALAYMTQRWLVNLNIWYQKANSGNNCNGTFNNATCISQTIGR